MENEFLTPAEIAESAFKARARALANEDWETEAWQNAFSVEVYQEYADDLERWTVALATLNMLADGAH
jgi:hypothetical protein